MLFVVCCSTYAECYMMYYVSRYHTDNKLISCFVCQLFSQLKRTLLFEFLYSISLSLSPSLSLGLLFAVEQHIAAFDYLFYFLVKRMKNSTNPQAKNNFFLLLQSQIKMQFRIQNVLFVGKIHIK